MNAPSVGFITALKSISASDIQTATRIFDKRSGRNTLSISPTDPELARIIILPILDGVDPLQSSATLSSFAEIEYAEPNYLYHIDAVPTANDSLYSQQWAHRVMHVPEAWQFTQGDSSIHIGFVDTGVEWDHPDLVGQFAVNPAEDINHNGLFDPWPSTEQRLDARGKLVYGDLDGIDEDGNGYIDDVIGYDFVDQSSLNFGDTKDRDPVPQDEESHTHGTAVAGVIAARANNGIGVAGIAPNCRLVALRAFDATGNAEDDDIASAIVYAADNNVRILNLSFGDLIPSLLQRDAIRYANAKGVLVFASSGNDGSTNPHYPSDFDECVSVGGTVLATDNISESDWTQSTHGPGMDVIAPGVQIYTLYGASGYQTISGTSFSSPEAAAVAGLLLSHNPHLSNTEIRSILESTAEHLSVNGFGPFEGNGRINAFTALKYAGSAAIKISSPHTNDAYHLGDRISITGSTISTLFSNYQLTYSRDLWNSGFPATAADTGTITSSDIQVKENTLGVWNTSGLRPESYTLTLTVNSNDRRSTIENIAIHFHPSNPSIISLSSTPIYVNEKRGLLIQATTDTLTTATIYFRQQGTSAWLTKKDDRLTMGHNILLSATDAPVATPLEIRFVAQNAAGDTVSQTVEESISSEAVSESGFVQKNYSLPLGFALDTILATPAGNQIVENTFPDGTDFGPLKIFSFDTKQKQFKAIDSLDYPWIPRAIGNTTGDNKPELLLQAGHAYKLYKQNAIHSLLGDLINADTTSLSKLAIGLADVDNDGKQELVVEDTEQIASGSFREIFKVLKVNGTSTSLVGKLIDTTPPGPFESTNNFNSPDIRVASIDASAKLNIITVDDDADIVAWEYDPNSKNNFRTSFQDVNDGATEGRLLTTGDFNGDGITDIALAYHTSYDPNQHNEYDASYWTVKVWVGRGDATFDEIYRDHFYLARSLSPFRASAGSIHNVTGKRGDNLVLSLFPNFYLLEYDQTAKTMRPIWHYPVSNSPRGAIAFDFDGNGLREFGFNSGDSLHFFEQEAALADQTRAPSGVVSEPRDSNRVDLSWGKVDGATLYYILRSSADPGAFLFLIDSTKNPFYSDTSVVNDSNYVYSILAFDSSKTIATSQQSFGVFAHVHPKPFVRTVTSNGTQITIHTSQPLATTAVDGGIFRLDDSLLTTSAIISGDSSLIATSPMPLSDSTQHRLQVNSFALRDFWNSPFDTSRIASWHPTLPEKKLTLYIVKWRFEGSSRIYLEFNIRPDDNALLAANYVITPFGTINSVTRDPGNSNAVDINLTPASNITALGVPFVICAHNITAQFSILLDESEGDCAGENLTEPDLEHLMVYPNPVRATDQELTFARLTSEAEISIYTLDMRFLKRLKTTDQNGGVKWDLNDEKGKPLPSGIYWYHVTGKDDNGNTVKSNEAKFVLIRNQ